VARSGLLTSQSARRTVRFRAIGRWPVLARPRSIIPPRLCTDLCEVGVGAEGLDAPGFGREGVPGSTTRVDDGLVVGQDVLEHRIINRTHS
jgi:hypothetical protein